MSSSSSSGGERKERKGGTHADWLRAEKERIEKLQEECKELSARLRDNASWGDISSYLDKQRVIASKAGELGATHYTAESIKLVEKHMEYVQTLSKRIPTEDAKEVLKAAGPYIAGLFAIAPITTNENFEADVLEVYNKFTNEGNRIFNQQNISPEACSCWNYVSYYGQLAIKGLLVLAVTAAIGAAIGGLVAGSVGLILDAPLLLPAGLISGGIVGLYVGAEIIDRSPRGDLVSNSNPVKRNLLGEKQKTKSAADHAFHATTHKPLTRR